MNVGTLLARFLEGDSLEMLGSGAEDALRGEVARLQRAVMVGTRLMEQGIARMNEGLYEDVEGHQSSQERWYATGHAHGRCHGATYLGHCHNLMLMTAFE